MGSMTRQKVGVVAGANANSEIHAMQGTGAMPHHVIPVCGNIRRRVLDGTQFDRTAFSAADLDIVVEGGSFFWYECRS